MKRFVKKFQELTDRWLLPKAPKMFSGQRGVVTTYRNNLEQQKHYLEYYRATWKPDWIVSLIGCDDAPSEGDSFGILQGRIVQTATDHYEIRYLTPKTAQGFLAVRNRLYSRVRDHSTASRILVTDCDEFVSGDVQNLWERESFLSHFVEYVPTKEFDPLEVSTWSTQSWFYRDQFLGKPNDIDHGRCKRFNLAEGKLGYHAGEDCGFLFPDDAGDRSTTFHVGVGSLEHYLTNKHFDQATARGENTSEVESDALRREKFRQFYEYCAYPTFEFRLWDLLDQELDKHEAK